MKCPLLVVLLLAASLAWADGPSISGGTYTIERYTVDSGGGQSSGGEFSIRGTIGQPDAGPTLSGATFQLAGGFWPGLNGTSITDFLFRDRFESQGRTLENAETDVLR